MANDTLLRMPEGQLTRPDNDLSAISGTVRSFDNHPIGDAKVEIRNLSSGTAVAYGYTGTGGNFEVNNLPRGTYEVVATSGLSEAREEIRLDGSLAQLTLRMSPTASSMAPHGEQTVSVQQLHVPEKAQAALRKAQAATEKGKYDEARQQIAKALNIEPKYSEALAYLGLLNMQTGDLNSAADDLQKAIECDNNSALAYTAMGSLYNLKNQFDDALRELDRSLALNPSSWQAHYEMARADIGKDDFRTALKEAEKAQALLGREFTLLHVVKGQALLGLKSYADAVDEFQKYLNESKGKESHLDAQVRRIMEQAKASTEARK